MENLKKNKPINFAKLADKQVGIIYLLMSVFLTIAYSIEVIEGSQPLGFLIAFVTADWGAFFASLIAKKINKGKGSSHKWVLCIGYALFYLLILTNLKNPLIFVYIIPIMIIMALYEDFKLLFLILFSNLAGVVAFIIKTNQRGMVDDDMVDSFKIVFASSLLIFLSVFLLIRYLIKLNAHNVAALSENLEQVKTTVIKVKEVSTSVVDGVNAVKEYADDNRVTAASVVDDMITITEQSIALNEKTSSSLEMTKEISNQVTQVSGLVEDTVTLANQSVKHAATSNEQLQDAIHSAREMRSLANQVETVLKEFKEEFAKVKTETSTINSISAQTNLLALNASIEAARAGEAGRGFSVVADEIRNLSEGTNQSSESIMNALDVLGSTSDNMTNSVERIIELIATTVAKVEAVAESVSAISSDSIILGTNVNNINQSVTEVENSNIHLVENMHSVNEIMGSIVDKFNHTANSSEEMRGKNEETSAHVISIEHMVNTLIEELGSSGILDIKDVHNGMSTTLKFVADNTEYKGIVSGVDDHVIAITFTTQRFASLTGTCNVSIIVENTTFHWENASVVETRENTVYVQVSGHPKVANRRKFPRMNLRNSCEISLKSEEMLNGYLANISANGLAFIVKDADIKMGELIKVRVNNFIVQKDLPSVVIRKVDLANGSIQYSCRMLDDDADIAAYVESNIKK